MAHEHLGGQLRCIRLGIDLQGRLPGQVLNASSAKYEFF